MSIEINDETLDGNLVVELDTDRGILVGRNTMDGSEWNDIPMEVFFALLVHPDTMIEHIDEEVI